MLESLRSGEKRLERHSRFANHTLGSSVGGLEELEKGEGDIRPEAFL